MFVPTHAFIILGISFISKNVQASDPVVQVNEVDLSCPHGYLIEGMSSYDRIEYK